MIRSKFNKWFIPSLLKKPCPERIPRTGEKAESINCYVVAYDDGEIPYFIATSALPDGLKGIKWNGKMFDEEVELSWEDLRDKDLRISHYYGTAEVIYTSIYRYLWNKFTKIIYFKIHSHRLIDNVDQYLFNKRELSTKQRIDLLQFMLEDQINRTHDGIDVMDLMTKLYSIKWVLHPTRDEQQKRLELYLGSLVDSKDIKKINDEYVVTGKAITTLEKYLIEERKHRETVKLQKKMFWLTFLLSIMAIIQAGLLKFPPIIDFTK